MIKKNEKGYVLVTSLLLMMVLTVIGLAAIGTSSFENSISGNIKERIQDVSLADGALELSGPLIKRCLLFQDTDGYNQIVDDAALVSECRGVAVDPDDPVDPQQNPGVSDVSFGSVLVDIDFLYKKAGAGSGLAMLEGYEGGGHGSAGGAEYYYRVNATNTGQANSRGSIGAIYRYIGN
jgi:Tfp pilus assembly protein PilX